MGSFMERERDHDSDRAQAVADGGEHDGKAAQEKLANAPAADAAARRMARSDQQSLAKALVVLGWTDENAITDQIFWLSHPEMAGRQIEHGSPLATQWLHLRGEIVRPALAAAKKPAAEQQPAQHEEKQPAPAPEPKAEQHAAPEVHPASPVEESHGGGDVANWTTILPHVQRDKQHLIREKKGGYGVDVPQVEMPALTADQQAVFEQIKANRDALPALMVDKADKHHRANLGAEGYSYHDARPASEKAAPDELQGSGKGREVDVKKLVWDEIGTEGGLDGINTYDDQIFTWGKGFSGGDLKEVMRTMFKEDPEAEKLLLRAGIALVGDTWMVVNNATGGVETGNNALRLLQYDNKLLSVFITLGSDPKHAQHAANAQWAYMKDRTGKVPKYAMNWPDDTIRLAAHLSHWMEHYGWSDVSYAGTGGDIYQYLVQFVHILASHYGTHTPSGAIVQQSYNLYDRPDHRLHAFAHGAGARALEANARRVQVTDEQLKSDHSLAGHILIPIDDKGAYFDIGA